MTNRVLSMNQFEQLIGLTRDHMRDSLFVYKATSSTGDTCHFGIESAAKAWAKGGTVEAIKVREFKLHTSSPTAAPVGELPELPPPVETAAKGPVAFFVKWTETGRPLNGHLDLYTADQMRAYALSARAALSAGDAVLAEREACAKLCEEVADDLITAMREEGETDDEAMTSFVASARVCAKEIRGGYSKKFNLHNAAIDAAMRKGQL